MATIKNILRWANVLLIIVTLLAYLSPYINPAAVWYFSIPGLGYPLLLLANLFFVGLWLFKRDRYFMFSLGCILVGLGYFLGFFGFSFFTNSKKGKDEITVMTFNTAALRNFDGGKADMQQQKIASLGKLAEKAGHPEVLCLQEVLGDHVLEAFKKAFGYTHYYKSKGTVIFSRFPFVKQDVVDFHDTGNSCIQADLQTPGGVVRVFCVHLQSNKMSYTANKLATKGDLRDGQTWRDMRFVLSRYKQGAQVRGKQANWVVSEIAKSPNPVIVCGDFNDTPISYVYRILSKNLQDSFREKGGGLGTTFAGKLPFLRIDYVLVDKKIQVRDHRILDSELSDHFPVLVRLKMGVVE